MNGKWAGKDPVEVAMKAGGSGAGTCENIWEWLQAQGQQGWELVSVTTETLPGANLTRLYLKRELL
ncbi:hypothetical protein [Pyxidicoccus xibeiensis]|uniref:hypothetical protein n=1 Tax=Pyxidicoccus xibeiensis TaxID=2906759 RepID=UPI0020A7102F|nr:hypothetical protein [Pyxidicoccus xibeiensis]MCP3142744.1 hypothetical protein [Pyxidicoccus xibeiensis]